MSKLTNKHIFILGIVVIVAAAVVTAFVLTRQNPENTLAISDNGAIPLIDESNVAEIQSEIEEKVAKGMFRTYMNTTWRFPDGTSASTNAVMGNSGANVYPFWFDVALRDTGETVFSSSLLPVGTTIKQIVLSKELDKGEYAATVRIHMVDENNEPVDTNTAFNITLVVGK
jgi:hypothetical protein